jgi:hypothetical protein
MPEIYIPLTDDEQTTLRTAAYGAVTLVSMAYPGVWSSTRVNVVGSKVLTGSTGTVGRVLSGKGKVDLKGGTTADIAETVLAAVKATLTTLRAKDPAAAAEFQRAVTTAVRQAAASARKGTSPAQVDMIDKITAAFATAA